MSTETAEVVDRGDELPAEEEQKLEAAEPETQAEPETEAEEKPEKPSKKDTRIPLSRHQELLNKERERRETLERQLAQYQQGSQVAKTNDQLTGLEDSVLKMEKEYNRLMADGEVDQAAALMTKIRQTERQIITTQAEMNTQVAMAQAAESARYGIALERIEEAYPELNEDSPEFDAEKMADVVDLKAVYQRRGMTPTQALQKAVLKFFGKAETRAQESATTVQPRVTEKDVAAERKKAAATKTADAVTKQPPSTTKAGLDNGRTTALTAADVMKMNQEAFAKLDEDTLKTLRGDDY